MRRSARVKVLQTPNLHVVRFLRGVLLHYSRERSSTANTPAKLLSERYLLVVRGRNPTQAKKSLRKAFSCMPTRPVAGEGLKPHLARKDMT